MKLIKAEINGFGHFQKQMFSFEDGNQLYFGRNEVGKSTLYQFIQAMLFGFPKKGAEKGIIHLKTGRLMEESYG